MRRVFRRFLQVRLIGTKRFSSEILIETKPVKHFAFSLDDIMNMELPEDDFSDDETDWGKIPEDIENSDEADISDEEL